MAPDAVIETPPHLPEETPEWGHKLLEIIQGEFRLMSKQMSMTEKTSTTNTKTIKTLESKLAKIEEKNERLETENVQLKECLLDLEFRQRRNNLIFEGVHDSPNESDQDCACNLRTALQHMPGLNSTDFKMDHCYRLDGTYRVNTTRHILCSFNWASDVQCVLKHRKLLPKDIYVNEDLPEEWVDRRRILKPIFSAAK